MEELIKENATLPFYAILINNGHYKFCITMDHIFNGKTYADISSSVTSETG